MDDFQLSPHFGFFEMTHTNTTTMQTQNRAEAANYIPTLTALANQILEPIRGDQPLRINSAFRWWVLNGLTAGTSATSQHIRGQAADISRPGMLPEVFFQDVLNTLKNLKIPFGQLIDESAQRDYGVTRWVHVSLGPDFWIPERCGEIWQMIADEHGKIKKMLLEKVDVLPWVS